MVSFAWYLSWNVYNKFIYQCKMIKLFLGIFRRDKRIFRNNFNPSFWPRTVTDRPGRPTAWSTEPRASRPNQGPVDPAVDRRAQPCARLADTWAGRPVGRRTRELCSLYLGGRPDCPNGHIYDRWRSTDRSTASLSGWQISLTASFLFGL